MTVLFAATFMFKSSFRAFPFYQSKHERKGHLTEGKHLA